MSVRVSGGLLLCAAALCAPACGGDAGDEAAGGAGGTGSSGGAGGAVGSGGAAGIDTFVAGMDRLGGDGHLSIEIVDATPAPPQRGLNDWRIRVKDAAGGPQADCTFEIGLFMPAHGHSSTTRPVVTAEANPGDYRVDDMNLFMPGVWEITLESTCGDLTDQVLFVFEIAR